MTANEDNHPERASISSLLNGNYREFAPRTSFINHSNTNSIQTLDIPIGIEDENIEQQYERPQNGTQNLLFNKKYTINSTL